MMKNTNRIILLYSLMITFLVQAIGAKEIPPIHNSVVAHRGAWKKQNLPQNSIASLEQAIALQCIGSEFDVRITGDDSLVVVHDPHHNQLLINETNYADLVKFRLSNNEKLPTLREYILAGTKNNHSTRLICEIKSSEMGKERSLQTAEKVLQLVEELNAKDKVDYISFDYDVLRKIVELNPSATTLYLEGNKSPEELKTDRISGLDYHYSVLKKHADWIEKANNNKLILNAWTVNLTEDMDWLIANGFDLITTDEPELLIERLKQSLPQQGMQLVWSDEFNSTIKSLPDSTKWSCDVNGFGGGNNEKQYYTDRTLENAYVENGILHIVALKKTFEGKEYTSAKLMTYERQLFQYGRFEIKAKIPRGKGTWPAIWMLPETIQTKEEGWPLCGEIDIMEHVGKDENMIHTSLHSELYNHIKGTQVTHFERQENVFDTFHEYAIEWTEQYIKFFIDKKLFYASYKGEDGRVSTNEGWPFDKPYYLILNLAIGGNWGGEIDNTIFPSEMEVDYVRIYQFKK